MSTNGIAASALANLLDLMTPADEIKWRQGQRAHSGECDRPTCRQPHKELAYVDARYVMRVLDSPLVGPENWQCVYAPGADGILLCGIGILVDGTWIWKWDGAGETDIEGEKGAASDAFKRAAVKWGIGRDLYSIGPRNRQPDAHPAAADSPVLTAGLDDESPPTCPYHHRPAVRSRYPDKKTGIVGWYCPLRASDGSPENSRGYCGWTA